jgi:hypothetical protein
VEVVAVVEAVEVEVVVVHTTVPTLYLDKFRIPLLYELGQLLP